MRWAILSLILSLGSTLALIRAYDGESFAWILNFNPYWLLAGYFLIFILYVIFLLAIDFQNRLAELLHILSTILFIPIFIILYTLAYDLIGLCQPGVECVYFSVVTFTTLGYGDILPVCNVARILAASEAFLGFLFVPILVAQFLSVVKDFRGV